jgi:cysteine desulfuration protein SufE
MPDPADPLASRTAEIVDEFAFLPDWMSRYEHLIDLGRSIPAIAEAHKTDAHRIHGCQAQVWVRADYEGGHVHFTGDSDAMITKGLAALLIRALTDLPPEAVATARLDFLQEIGLEEHLSPTRKNGLHAMVQQMKERALALAG